MVKLKTHLGSFELLDYDMFLEEIHLIGEKIHLSHYVWRFFDTSHVVVMVSREFSSPRSWLSACLASHLPGASGGRLQEFASRSWQMKHRILGNLRRSQHLNGDSCSKTCISMHFIQYHFIMVHCKNMNMIQSEHSFWGWLVIGRKPSQKEGGIFLAFFRSGTCGIYTSILNKSQKYAPTMNSLMKYSTFNFGA